MSTNSSKTFRHWALFKKLYIVSFDRLYRDYAAMVKMYYLYEVFPLGELVKYIIRLAPQMDYQEALWNEVEKRFGDKFEKLDFEELEIFLDTLVQAVDEELIKMLPGVDILELTTVKWLNTTDVLLGVKNE